MQLTFYGGAGGVSASNYMLESVGSSTSLRASTKILIDCGLHQGSHYAERENFEPFKYDPKEIEAVFVTHAHVDHVGLIPKLVRDGFKGQIFSTPPTRDFAELLLLDSERILYKEAEREGKQPFYGAADVTRAMEMWKGITYHEPVAIGNFTVELFDAGHILGSSIIQVKAEGKTIVFSGDLGNSPAPIIMPTEQITAADYCLIESTYGGRVHEPADTQQELLEDAIEDTVKAGGVLLIPAFAMERTQDLLYQLNKLIEGGRVPRIPVFIDSPLAIKLTAVYKKYENYFNPETRAIIRSGEDILKFPGLRFTPTTEESKGINNVPPPKIIIAGSGMSHGGRILHHEIRYLPDPKSMILFVGYQAQGSLGRRIMEGAKSVSIFGEQVDVRCKMRVLSGYSAHADQPRLLEWLVPMRNTLKKVFVVQGEPVASEALAEAVRDDLVVETVIPKIGDSVVL